MSHASNHSSTKSLDPKSGDQLGDKPLPFAPYRELSNEVLRERITAAKKTLGPSLLILGHHYQQDEVIEHADLTGDSYQLSKLAAESPDCRYIVFGDSSSRVSMGTAFRSDRYIRVDAGDLHQQRSEFEVVLWQAWRNCLHEQQCQSCIGVVIRTAQAGVLFPRSAPWSQHFVEDGY